MGRKLNIAPVVLRYLMSLLSFSAQMKQEVGSILDLLLPLTQNLSGPVRSEALDRQDDMQAMLLQLKGVAQNLAHVSSTQVV